jgi:hypothetical protein
VGGTEITFPLDQLMSKYTTFPALGIQRFAGHTMAFMECQQTFFRAPILGAFA